MIIHGGISDAHRDQAADLYWGAFGAKLGQVLGPTPKAMRYITRVLDGTHGISAVDSEGRLLGVAGFKTHQGALVGGGFGDMVAIYGTFGAMWRVALLSLLERDVENDRFLMDGIFVAPAARGQGVGTALLDAICEQARTRGYAEVRLDVINTNPRARALYERQGFRPVKTDHLGPLSWVFGFKSSTTMVRLLS